MAEIILNMSINMKTPSTSTGQTEAHFLSEYSLCNNIKGGIHFIMEGSIAHLLVRMSFQIYLNPHRMILQIRNLINYIILLYVCICIVCLHRLNLNSVFITEQNFSLLNIVLKLMVSGES